MKENTCNYSDEWQPYIGDYDKFEYDVKMKDGTIVENCYPNAGKFNSISESHDQMSFDGADVVEIRFSEKPRFGINGSVSERHQYEWLDRKGLMCNDAEQEVFTLYNQYKDLLYYYPEIPKSERGRMVIPVRNSKTDPKIQRNDPCPCGSGKKYKQCCISKS